MKIHQVAIHNFRSIADAHIDVQDYSLLIGANNSGKSNVVDAMRAFYEKDIKFEFGRDFPKMPVSDQESWVEIEFRLANDEVPTIKTDYLIAPDRFRVRKWLFPAEKAKEGLFGYENGTLSSTAFYGWKNVSQGKLGDVIYIPAVSRLEEHTKLSGPSALRDLLNDIVKPIIKSSPSFATLASHFTEFSSSLKAEETEDKRSLTGLESLINSEIGGWGAQFSLSVEAPKEEDVVKNLIGHKVTDLQLGHPLSPEAFGHGFQRHLIFTLLRVAARYTPPRPAPKKKDFAPQLSLLLFEEPEAFLHLQQQEVLDASLRQLAIETGRQVLAATHSPHFVSFNTDDIVDLVKINKAGARTQTFSIARSALTEIFDDNQALKSLIDQLRGRAIDAVPPEVVLDLESTRHFLWLDPNRCGLFFADFVLLVEGLSEQVLTSYLLRTGLIARPSRSVFVLECCGKYNLHRFMALLGALHIPHAVLHDADLERTGKDLQIHTAINKLIREKANDFTEAIETLPSDLERFLGVTISGDDRHRKASAVLLSVKNGSCDANRLAEFAELVARLAHGAPAASTDASPEPTLV